jgi:hypothetical protein
MTAYLQGMLERRMQTEDPYGHRTYKVKFLVVTNNINDGPQVASMCPGLPVVGTVYNYGNDLDTWAICHPEAEVEQVLTKEPNNYFIITNTFSTKPIIRCQDVPIGNPLNEPPLISGSFVKYTQETGYDAFNLPLFFSSLEPMRGPQVERDFNRPTVEIQMNVPLMLPQWFAMIDCINQYSMWGLNPHAVKLSNMPWRRIYWGSCNFYYQVTFQFDINLDPFGFDRQIVDVGTRSVIGGGDACAGPLQYENYRTATGDLSQPIPLNGSGSPATCTCMTLVDSRQYLGVDDDGNLIVNPNFGLPVPNPYYVPGHPALPDSCNWFGQYLQYPYITPYYWLKQLYYQADLSQLPVPATLTG